MLIKKSVNSDKSHMLMDTNHLFGMEMQEQSRESVCICISKIYALFGHIKSKFVCFVHFASVYQIMLSFTP